MLVRPAALALTLACALAPGVAAADPDDAPPPDVPSTAGGPIVNLHIDYEYEHDRSTIAREALGGSATTQGAIPLHNEMQFHQDQHTVTPAVEVAVYKNFWLYGALPIVISQTRGLDVASGAERGSLSTISDGILPSAGLDASDPTGGFGASSNELFRSVARRGLTQLHMGFGIAPMNQHDDDTKPNWRIGAEYRLAVGKVMKFDALDPSGENGVSTGVDEARVWTSVDRQLGRLRPWVDLFWQIPVRASSSSLFQNNGFGSTNVLPGQQGGGTFGLDINVYDHPEDHNRVTLGIGGRVIGHFEGRGYSELWEVFANAGDPRNNGTLALDADPITSGVQPLAHPGIDNIENYLETGVRLALRAELGAHVRLSAVGDLTFASDHTISFGNAGVDLPTCSATKTTNCETSNNDLVNPGTAEVNPQYQPKIDLVGHRYQSDHNLGIIIGLQAGVVF